MKGKMVITTYRIILFSVCLASSLAPNALASHAEIDILIRQLEHKDKAVQIQAHNALVKIGEPAVSILIETLNHDEKGLGRKAADILTEIGLPATGSLINALDHKNVMVRLWIPGVLSTIVRNATQTGDQSNVLEKEIVPALIKALKDENRQVHEATLTAISDVTEALGSTIQPEMEGSLIQALIELLDYDAPYFNLRARKILVWGMGTPGKSALTEALNHKRWAVRFGAALGYGHVWASSLLSHNPAPPDPFPQEIVPILAEGITKTDENTRDDAAIALHRIGSRVPGAAEALKAYPPFTLTKATVKDGVQDVNPKPLNRDGITFEFSNSLRGGRLITIKPFLGEPLGWETQWKRHSVTITPPKGKELVGGKAYLIQIEELRDVAWNRFDVEIIFFTTEE